MGQDNYLKHITKATTLVVFDDQEFLLLNLKISPVEEIIQMIDCRYGISSSFWHHFYTFSYTLWQNTNKYNAIWL